MINVRLSEEEYLELERFCVATGARSISDFVRSTMHNVVTTGNRENSLASRFNEYSTHVKDLEQRVKELAAELTSFRAGVKLLSVKGTSAKDGAALTKLPADAKVSPRSAIKKKLPRKMDS
jgi:chromosome segregation ATPase